MREEERQLLLKTAKGVAALCQAVGSKNASLLSDEIIDLIKIVCALSEAR